MSGIDGDEQVNWDVVDGRDLARKQYADLNGYDLARIARGQPAQLRVYAEVAASQRNTELLSALGTTAFMQFRIPQNQGYHIPQQLFDGYQEAFDYIRDLSKKLASPPQ